IELLLDGVGDLHKVEGVQTEIGKLSRRGNCRRASDLLLVVVGHEFNQSGRYFTEVHVLSLWTGVTLAPVSASVRDRTSPCSRESRWYARSHSRERCRRRG